MSSCCRSARHRDRHSGEAHQVAGGHGELELLIDALQSAKHGLANPADGLAPAEVLLDPLADDLAQAVARMASGAAVDRAAAAPGVVAGDVRRDLALATGGDEVGRVVGLVGADAAATGVPGSASSMATAARRSPKPSAWVTTALTTRPLRFSISAWPW